MTYMLLNPRLLIALVLAAALAGAAWWVYGVVYDRGAASVQAEWDADRLQQAQAQAAELAKVAAQAKALQANADTLRKTKNAQIDRLNSELAAALAGLSDRPPRPSADSMPSNTTSGAGCYPAALYREDAAVALQLAGEADKLRADLQQCQAAYGAARKAWLQ